MNELKIFENKEFGKIRTIELDDEIYFVGNEIATILGYKNTRDALLKHVDNEDKISDVAIYDGSQNRNMIIINESGLYSLIMSSKLSTAKKFKRWVTSEVLPSIRKHGGYISGQENMTDEELMARAILMANSKIQELHQKNQELEFANSKLLVANETMRPKADYFDDLVDRNLLTGFRETEKALNIKEKAFINFLLEHKYLFRDKKGKLQPFAEKNKGLFELKESKNDKTGWVGTQTLITPKGRETFRLLCVGI